MRLKAIVNTTLDGIVPLLRYISARNQARKKAKEKTPADIEIVGDLYVSLHNAYPEDYSSEVSYTEYKRQTVNISGWRSNPGKMYNTGILAFPKRLFRKIFPTHVAIGDGKKIYLAGTIIERTENLKPKAKFEGDDFQIRMD